MPRSRQASGDGSSPRAPLLPEPTAACGLRTTLRHMRRHLGLLLLLPACLGAQATARVRSSTGFARADTAKLHQTLDAIAASHRGVVGYMVHNLDTGERLSLRGDEKFPTASLIKVAVLVTLFDLVEKGMMSLDDRVTMSKIDKVDRKSTRLNS